MLRLEERLSRGEVLVVDGAMGTFLQAMGLEPGESPELWCVTRPEAVLDIHRQYREAGSDVVECNSFGGSSYKLRHFGLEARVAEINEAAAALARQVAGDRQYVMGSIGPTGAFLEPYGDETEEKFYEAFAEQAKALEAGGADVIVIETMMAIEECCVAIRAARENTNATVVGSFTFDPQVTGGYASMMGVRPANFAQQALEAGAHVIGANCGTGPDDMVHIVREMRAAAPEALLMAMPNAGMPVLENGVTVFKETPEEMGAKSLLLKEAGARLIGGCCGTGPKHIAAMVRALRV